MTKEQITLSPKERFLENPATASAHSDAMAAPAFQNAAAAALLAYQYQITGGDPALLPIVAAKLRGAQEFLRVLMNLGIPDITQPHSDDSGLEPPEQSLDRPYEPPTRKK